MKDFCYYIVHVSWQVRTLLRKLRNDFFEKQNGGTRSTLYSIKYQHQLVLFRTY